MDIILTEQNGWRELDHTDIKADDRHAIWDAWPAGGVELPLDQKIEVESFEEGEPNLFLTPAEILFRNGFVDVATASVMDLEGVVLLKLPPHSHIERIWIRTRKPFVKAYEWYER